MNLSARGVILFLSICLAVTGCARQHLNDPNVEPPIPRDIVQGTISQTATARRAGCVLQVPQAWIGDDADSGLYNLRYIDGFSLSVETYPTEGQPEEARAKMAASRKKVEMAVSGRALSQEGAFKGRYDVIYWLRYPSGGCANDPNVIEYYFPADPKHHYLMRVQFPYNSEQDYDTICDSIAASADFEPPLESR